MTIVGIIANPASGKDIRRLIAQGSVFDNQEKVNIVRRVLLGLQAAGVDEVVFMPDYFGIGKRATEGVKLELSARILEMRIDANQEDSTQAARRMREMGVGAVITLGGDGTNRAVAKEIGDIPMMPISTGTNNVFPRMVEGTIAGLAAGFVACGRLPLEETTHRHLRLEVKRDDQLIDIALVDVVVYVDAFIGSRAIWDMTKVRDILMTRASPSNIGLSSIGGGLYCAQLNRKHGVYIRVKEGPGQLEMTAPIAPGLVETVHVSAYQLLNVGDEIPITDVPSILALDGEREAVVRSGDQVSVGLSDRGPLVIDLERAMEMAAQRCQYVTVNVDEGALPPGVCILHSAGICKNPTDQCVVRFNQT